MDKDIVQDQTERPKTKAHSNSADETKNEREDSSPTEGYTIDTWSANF